ncbi:MAG: hypothetical protein ACREDK_01545 [Thermoplasmata archaeon]
MPKSCPECGAAVEFTSQTTEVLQGACTACHHAFVLLPVQSTIENLGTPTPSEADAEEDDAESLLPCPSCGEGLELESEGADRLKATCEGCGTVVAFRREGADEEDDEGEAPERPMRAPFRRDDREGEEAPRARPCRQCGAPLKFETNADQTVTGRCEACGNEFTLPPRRDDRRGGTGRSYGRSGGTSRFSGGGGGRSRFGGSSYRGRSGPPRGGSGRPRRDRDDEGDRRRRRRE